MADGSETTTSAVRSDLARRSISPAVLVMSPQTMTGSFLSSVGRGADDFIFTNTIATKATAAAPIAM